MKNGLEEKMLGKKSFENLSGIVSKWLLKVSANPRLVSLGFKQSGPSKFTDTD